MIVFVEEEAGGETGQVFGKFDAMLVDSLDFDSFGSFDRAVQVRDGETALESGATGYAPERLFFARIENDGIEVDFNFFIEVSDKTTEVVTDLGEGKADANRIVGVFESVDQIDDFLLNIRGEAINRSGLLAQNCVGNTKNWCCHEDILSWRVFVDFFFELG